MDGDVFAEAGAVVPEGFAYLADHLRAGDALEVRAIMQTENVAQGLLESIAQSQRWWWAAHAGGGGQRVLALWGVGGHPSETGLGVPWFVCTDDLMKHVSARRFLEHSRAHLDDISRDYRWLANVTHASHTTAHRWLRWLGFAVSDTTRAIHGEPFKDFYRLCAHPQSALR